MVPVKAIDSERMRGNFSSHAGDYDRYACVQKRVVALLCSKMSALEVKSGTILDVGTGTGALATAIASQVSEQPLVIMDIAHGMTHKAAQRMPGAFACDGDARFLPFGDHSFSTVVSSSVYQWVNCLPTAFTEVARILKPGGLFAMALFGEKTLHELRSSHRHAVAENNQSGSSHVQSFPALNEVSTAIELAGLTCHELCSTMEVEYHRDVPDLLRQLKQIGASNAAADRPRGLASRQVMQSMMKEYELSYRCEAGLPASYEVIITVAQKLERGRV
jgi:malonyl-CoA O-methyltransferase